MTFIQNLIKSLGLKRKLAALFQILTTLVQTNPTLAPFASYLQTIASFLGIGGIGHAVTAGTVWTNILATAASFFAALVIAAQSVPQLAPYAKTIQLIATFLSFLVAGKSTVKDYV